MGLETSICLSCAANYICCPRPPWTYNLGTGALKSPLGPTICIPAGHPGPFRVGELLWAGGGWVVPLMNLCLDLYIAGGSMYTDMKRATAYRHG